jgi:NAD(P)-dependent dehydrogenase (short-subunit alcohol dehydrogenase family)
MYSRLHRTPPRRKSGRHGVLLCFVCIKTLHARKQVVDMKNTPGGKMGLIPEQMADFGEMIARVPLNRPGEAEEVGAGLHFASHESCFTMGTELPIDGGITPLLAFPNFKLNRKE